jgi:hypothetical protein
MTRAVDAGTSAAITPPVTMLSWRKFVLPFVCPVRLLTGLTWRGIAYLVLISAAWALLVSGHAWWLGINPDDHAGHTFIELYPTWFMNTLVGFSLQMLALVIADNLRVRRLPRAVTLTLALLLGSLVTGLVGELRDPSPSMSAMITSLLNITTGHSVVGGVFAFVFFTYRHDVEVAEALHRAELDRVALRKKTLESGLQLMQARVEPLFLFDTLRGVGDLYESDHATADRMLDNVILYLRAALPQMRCSQSTLGREIQLARAYLEIERIRWGDRLRADFVVPEDLMSSTFPPMVLLPLIEVLALRNVATARERTLRVEVRAESEALAIELNCSGVRWSGCDEVESVRGRLLALYGAATRLDVVQHAPLRITATLRVPRLSAIASVEWDDTLAKTETPRVPS